MLTAPQEKKKFKTFTWDACMSYLLAFGVLLMQGVLLYCVYEKVVVNNADWQDGIMTTTEDWKLFAPKGKGCNDGSSLCTIENGTFTCAPPSVQLTGRWHELDLNGDDYWSRDEVMKSREDLKCKYVVDPLEIFDIFVQLLVKREKLIWIHPDLRAGRTIHKSYFTYVMGDVVMCTYRNQDMCGNLVKRGVFHAPLKYGTSPRVGTTVETALDYCRDLLAPRGTCEKMLPSTYATWKIESVVQCKKPKYSKFVYENPGNGVIKSLLSVDYKARQRYEMARTMMFNVYKSFIVGVWVLLIVSQLRGVVRDTAWAIFVPAEVPATIEPATLPPGGRRRDGLAAKSRSGRNRAEEEPVEGIDAIHRTILLLVNALRIGMLCVLMYVGLSFLARQTDYIGLLLDGIALIFIIEVAEIIYARVLRDEVRKAWGDHDSLFVRKIGIPYFNTRPDMEDMFWLFVVITMTAVFMWRLNVTMVSPLYDALECTCLSKGATCREAQKFNSAWWDNYWRYAVPETFKQIDALKAAVHSTSFYRKLNHPATLLSTGH